MTRILGIVLLLFILRLAVKSFSAQLRAAVGAPPSARVPPPRAAAAAVTETLVACAACGTYLPASRALKRAGGGGEIYCSEECREKGLK